MKLKKLTETKEGENSSSSLILSLSRLEVVDLPVPRPRVFRELLGIECENPRPAQPRLGTLTSGRDPTSCSIAL